MKSCLAAIADTPDVRFLHHCMEAIKMFWLNKDNGLMAGILHLIRSQK